MAASGFLLVASFLLALFILAQPLATLLTRRILSVPWPVVSRAEPLLWYGG